jgi:general secretion pathway protein A
MYLNHFKLSERPFSITPDPRFLYMSACHREALAHLLYGLGEGGGFVQLTGEVGTGKTTICRCLMEQVPANVDIAVVLNPKVTATELIATMCDELGVEYPRDTTSIKTLTDVLNRHLLDSYSRGRRTVLIIDEAQNLSAEVLEQIRLLTNLETAREKLLQIILIGQPELRTLLSQEHMRQLAQRVTARYHLEPIGREDARAYIQHRLQVCGTSHAIFSKGAMDLIQRLSGGIPRLINVLCDRAMLGAYVEGKSQVDSNIVKKASREVLESHFEDGAPQRWIPRLAWGLAIAALVVAAVVYQPWRFADIRLALFGDREAPVAAGVVAPDPVALASPVSAQPAPEPVMQEGPAASPAETPVEKLPVPVSLPEAEAGAEPEAEPEAEASSGPVLATLLQAADSSWYRHAWTDLLARWSVTLPPDAEPDFCTYAAQNGLQCLIEKGDWDALRFLDRPVIMKLQVEGRHAPVMLSQLDNGIALLSIGGDSHRVPVDEITGFWDGDFILVLQAPPGGTMYMELGGKGPDVGWLRQQLELARGIDLPSDDPLYLDYKLYQQVLAFQRDNGLVTDGVVGRYTIIQLNSLSGVPGIPRLSVSPS